MAEMVNGFQEIFKRIELKYMMTRAQADALQKRLSGCIREDAYGLTRILNIYLDTPDFFLIRQSVEKPRYKEKMRLRCYGVPESDSLSFLEIKKKYDGVVYKRRIGLPYREAYRYVRGRETIPEEVLTEPESGQIAGELDYFMKRYPQMAPRVMVSYNRIAYVGLDDPELRLTFDSDLRFRETDTDLRRGYDGKKLMDEDAVLMELKIAGAVPLEIAHALSDLNIWQTSFSKYGKAYEDLLMTDLRRQGKITDLLQYKEEMTAKSKLAYALC